MALINGKEVLTVKYEGKIFAVECVCSQKKDFVEREYEVRDVLNTTICFSHKIDGGHTCGTCKNYPWIILPRKS